MRHLVTATLALLLWLPPQPGVAEPAAAPQDTPAPQDSGQAWTQALATALVAGPEKADIPGLRRALAAHVGYDARSRLAERHIAVMIARTRGETAEDLTEAEMLDALQQGFARADVQSAYLEYLLQNHPEQRQRIVTHMLWYKAILDAIVRTSRVDAEGAPIFDALSVLEQYMVLNHIQRPRTGLHSTAIVDGVPYSVHITDDGPVKFDISGYGQRARRGGDDAGRQLRRRLRDTLR